jgi:hypothetical protein
MTKAIERPEKVKKYRALATLIYSELVPALDRQVLARPGDITELYPELTRYPDRVKLLIDLGAIEEVPDVEIIRPIVKESES